MTSDTYADNTFRYPVAYVPARRGLRFYFAAGPRFPFLLREPHKGDDGEEEGEPGIGGGDDGRVSQSANKSGGVTRVSRWKGFPNHPWWGPRTRARVSRWKGFPNYPWRPVPPPEYLTIVSIGLDHASREKKKRDASLRGM